MSFRSVIPLSLVFAARIAPVLPSATSVLGESVERVRTMDARVGDPADASAEQSQGISQVNDGASEMDKITHANAASAEESASAAPELKQHPHELDPFLATLGRMDGPRGAAASAGTRAPGAGPEARAESVPGRGRSSGPPFARAPKAGVEPAEMFS